MSNASRKRRRRWHGGAWKIAYADFVTAMMAFFLLMWLLGSTTKGDLQGIADYFQTPLKVAMAGGSGSGDSSSVIKGGGRDLTRSVGQIKKSDDREKSRKTYNLKAAQAEMARMEKAQLEALKQRIDSAIENSPTLKQYKNQLLIDITTDGLRIQIVDEQNRPMFALAKAELQPYTREILLEIGQLLNGIPNKISLSGHTDATPFQGGEKGYSNWELSADRANASRRALVAGGMDEAKVLRVVGLSSAVPVQQGQSARSDQSAHQHHRDEQESGRSHHRGGRQGRRGESGRGRARVGDAAGGMRRRYRQRLRRRSLVRSTRRHK